MTTAIIATGGKQYRVTVGQLVQVEKLDAAVGSTVTFDQVLAVVEGGVMEVGNPTVAQVVTGEVVEQKKDKKIRVFTYKSKKRQRRTLGHRQPLTVVRIASIGVPKAAPKKEAEPKAVKPAAKKPVAKKA